MSINTDPVTEGEALAPSSMPPTRCQLARLTTRHAAVTAR